MTRFNRIYKELSIALGGLKKGILEVAITTSENTQVAKLLFRVFELENNVDKLYIDIGKMVYELRHLTFDEIMETKDIKDSMDAVKTIQQDIQNLEKEIDLLRGDRIKSKLEELQRYMRRGGYAIEGVLVEKDSIASGKGVGELGLPPGVTIISIIHHDLFAMPEDGLHLEVGDRVFLLGPREKISEGVSLFAPPELKT